VTTHGTEMQARQLDLALTHRDGSGLNLVAPPSPAAAPPGWYMLFLLSDDGVPSVARWVHVEGTWVAPPQTKFGKQTRVTVPATQHMLDGNAVKIGVRNGNRFRIPTHAALRLTGGAAHTASVGDPVATDATLVATGTTTLRLRLGHKRAAFVRRRGYTTALLTLHVRDPSGHTRTVRRKLTLRKQHP
jgi:hypothetical protein